MKKIVCVVCCTWLGYILMAQTPIDGTTWISSGSPTDAADAPCPLFRKKFRLDKTVRNATLYITAHGIYEATINNNRVGNAYFTPGYTPYDKRLLYQTYDVTGLLNTKIAENMITVTVGDGWYRGIFGTALKKNNYGRDASLLCKLLIEYSDGTKDSLISDKTWESSTGPIRRSSIYMGELQDENFESTEWLPVKVDITSQVNLEPSIAEPITKQETFIPRKIFKDKNGEAVIDFGQNMAGWVQVKVKRHKGDTIKISHAEVLDKEGNFSTASLRLAEATDTYILNGKGTETLEPHFTYHGFRYAKVGGFVPTKKNCIAIALHSNLKHTGTFSCSNPIINQLQHNIEWSLNSNLFDIPTDCPQRAERLGWTADAQVIFKTAVFNRDVQLFFDKWLKDLELQQSFTGAVSRVVPDSYNPKANSFKWIMSAWGDAATIIPMDFFEAYNDTALLRRQYTSMKSWARYELSRSDPFTHLWTDFTFGDYQATGPVTDSVFIDQCYMINSIRSVLKANDICKLNDPDSVYLKEYLHKCEYAFQENFINADGTLSVNTQTACVLALHLNVVPKNLISTIVQQLVMLINENKDHLATGFLGTPFILGVLTKNGQTDLAYTLLEQETVPSWLYPIKMGATTIWETWDAVKPDGSSGFQSLNHYAFGAVGDYLYEYIAGIQAASPGYQKIKIEPHPGGELTWVNASYECKYGKIISNWKIENGKFMLHAEIPNGATATIILPGGKKQLVGSGIFDF